MQMQWQNQEENNLKKTECHLILIDRIYLWIFEIVVRPVLTWGEKAISIKTVIVFFFSCLLHT